FSSRRRHTRFSRDWSSDVCSSDLGADLILQKDGLNTVVQIKRYHQDHRVGVQDVNQVIGAAKYYKADQIMIVTTSELTQPATERSEERRVGKECRSRRLAEE